MNTAPSSASSAKPMLTEEYLALHLRTWLTEHGDSLIALRHYIHAHPEHSGAEHATTALLVQRLQAAG